MAEETTRKFTMRAYGEVGSQRAPTGNGEEVHYGPSYSRTLSLTEFKVKAPGNELTLLFKKEEVPEGGLICSLYEDEGCIRPRKEFGSRFKATLLEKVYLTDNMKQPREEFYPVLKRLLDTRRNWGTEFIFHGLSFFIPHLMEWTERILDKYQDPLEKAGVCGLVKVSQFPYNYAKEVWRVFSEQWSPLTNTLHHGGGEVGISLNDLKVIGGLPILGDPYEEYLPPNELLFDEAECPSTVAELLQIHATLCRRDDTPEVSWSTWINHFYRGKQTYSAYGETLPNSRKGKSPSLLLLEDKPRKPLPLRVSPTGELAAYLALLLSRFVLPSGSKSIRPETFVMASFMAQGIKISLAPTVLGHIYHGLGEMATSPGNPGNAQPCFGIHFVVGWIAEYFPCLYPCRPDDEFEGSFPSLAKYAGVLGHDKDLYQARFIFRGTERVFYRAVDFGLQVGGKDYSDSDELSDECFEHLLSLRSSLLPFRFGAIMMLEPYYPNRFARQFGFDQGIPHDPLSFTLDKRAGRSLEKIAIACAQLFRRNTGAVFHIPHSYCVGTYIYAYCGWWARVSAPILRNHAVKSNLS